MEDVFDNSIDELRAASSLHEPIFPFSDFSSASKAAVAFLRAVTSFELCAVTRIEENELILLSVNDSPYGLKPGDTITLERGLCSGVVNGECPKFIADTGSRHGSGALERLGSIPDIGAHIGVPLILANHTVFGTICAINRDPMPDLTSLEITAIELTARMLSTVLSLELQSLDQRRRYERAKRESESDELTGLLNRRGWDRAVSEEDILCAQYGFSASVMVIDLDNLKIVNDTQGHKAGDGLLRKAAEIIEQTCRADDVVARTGGDEFAVLTKGISQEGLQAFARRIRIALMVAGVSASVGTSTRSSSKSLIDAWTEADEAMYVSKRSKPIL
ncbi:MAG: sensor domain-containing diguanylate cyclase [Acidimicrobiaceae bacterium]|nr:sensor domain-containing diguanylate cyclase [Acidimicrobiaceae bacterium]